MRFMMLMYPDKTAEQGVLPDEAILSAMMKYNEELADAGVLIGLDGLQPTSKGARIQFVGGRWTATDGPFTEAKEVLGGYWMIQVKSKQEAIDWAMRCPLTTSESEAFIEIRQVFEAEDFGPALTPELREQEEKIAAQIAA